MRFPRLSHLFHRRAKSDGALAEVQPEPMATLPSRPVSANGLDDLILGSVTPHELLYADAGVPASATHPPPHITLARDVTHQADKSTSYELKQRIRELEAALNHQYKVNRRIPALERALAESRNTLESASTASTSAHSEVSALRTRLIHTQRALHTALTSAPTADDRARVLAAENATLTSERLRHRKFIELLIAVGAHKPVLAHAYDDITAGVEPEEALVAAIREALARPDSPWVALLEPVIGPRAPEEYKAQVRATLGARKEAREWRKRAKWWKGRAREAGMAVDGVITPSPSDISSIAEVLPEDRERAREELRERKRGGKGATDQVGEGTQKLRKESFVPVRETSLPTQSALATLASTFLTSLSEDDLAGVAEAAVPAFATATTLPIPTSCSAEYPRLAPLASQVFRASMSQSSIYTNCRKSSMSYAPSLSSSFSFPHFKKATAGQKMGLSASSSVISNRSKRRRVEVVAVATPSASASTALAHCRATSTTGAPSTTSSIAKLAYIHEDNEPKLSPSIQSLPKAVSRFASVPSGSASTMRTDSPTPVPPCSSEKPPFLVPTLPGHAPDSDSDSDDELVIVMHADAPRALRNSPALSSAPFSPPRVHREMRGIGTPSPDGKSRLPVLKKAIRRLSISKPVLVDTTNAATFTFTRAKAPARNTKVTAKGVERENGGSAKVSAPPSPSRVTQIPTGMSVGKKTGQVRPPLGFNSKKALRKATA